MKTIFLKSAKLLMFLLFAAFGSYVGTAQVTQPNVIISPIGGSKTPDPGPYTNKFISNPPIDTFIVDIGGRNSDGTIFVGGNLIKNTVAVNEVEIGGRQGSGPHLFTRTIAIGGKDKPEPTPIAIMTTVGKKESIPDLVELQNILAIGGESTKPTMKDLRVGSGIRVSSGFSRYPVALTV